MEDLGALLAGIGGLGLMGSWLYTMYFAQRDNLLWVVMLLFFPGLAHIAFAIHDRSRRKWAIPFFGSLALTFAGNQMMTSPLLGWLLLIGLFAITQVGPWQTRRFHVRRLRRLFNRFGRRTWDVAKDDSQHEYLSGGISYNSARFQDTVIRNEALLDKMKGNPTLGFAQDAFRNDSLIADIIAFRQRYYLGAEKDEDLALYLDLMQEKYTLEPANAKALLFYVDDELIYYDFEKSFELTVFEDVDQFLVEIISAEIVPPPPNRHITRLIKHRSGEELRGRALTRQLNKAKRRKRLQSFDETLSEHQEDTYSAFDEFES